LLKRTGQGRCKTIILEFQKNDMILLDIEEIHLLIIADKSAKLGHVILVSEKNRKKLHKIEKVSEVPSKIKKETTPEEPKSLPEEKEEVKGLPEIKPPISFPTMEKEVKIPK